tara:strand:- start:5071 stop:5274 length:204 start_codon:yes stop_codon:yes gene_type:complete
MAAGMHALIFYFCCSLSKPNPSCSSDCSSFQIYSHTAIGGLPNGMLVNVIVFDKSGLLMAGVVICQA